MDGDENGGDREENGELGDGDLLGCFSNHFDAMDEMTTFLYREVYRQTKTRSVKIRGIRVIRGLFWYSFWLRLCRARSIRGFKFILRRTQELANSPNFELQTPWK